MPDPKVIGKISSTLEEIRDILVGSKPSKLYNSIQAIATTNIAMTELMKELVDYNKEKKEINLKKSIVGNKLSNDLQKTANKTMSSISKTLKDIAGDVGKISKKAGLNFKNKDDRKALDNIIKDVNKDSKGNKLLGMINVITQLQGVKIKDLFTAKLKVKKIEEIYGKLIGVFEKVKEKKDIKPKELNEFALNAITIVKKLSKIAFLSKLATMGAKAINKVFFGKGGLITTLCKMKKHEKDIKKAKKITNDLFILTGKIFVISLMMSGVALLGLTAILGAVITAGMILVLGLAVSVLGIFEKPIKKGNAVMGSLMVSLILAGAGLWLLNKGTKDMDWEQLAKAGVAIVGFGLIAALLGIPYVFPFVVLGCVALTFMGISLIAIGGGVALFGLMVTDKAIEKVSTGIPKIFTAMTSIFGDEKPGKASFGNTIMGMVTGLLRLGGSLYASGALMIMGVALGFLAICLKPWENFNTKAIDNIEYAMEKLDDVFGLNIRGDKTTVGSVLKAGAELYFAPYVIASSLLSAGKMFLKMGTLLFAGLVLGVIKESLDKWQNFNTKSLDNIDTAMTKLDDMFDLGIKRKSVVEDVVIGAIDYATGTWQIASTLLKAGKTFIKLGTLMAGIFVMDYAVQKMMTWKSINQGMLKNVLGTVKKFSDFFDLGLGDEFNDKGERNEGSGFWSKLGHKALEFGGNVFNYATGIFQLGGSLITAGKQFIKLGMLSMAIGVVGKMVEVMMKVSTSGISADTLTPVFTSFDVMMDYLFSDKVPGSSMWDDIANLGKVAIGGLLGGPIGMLGGALIASDERKTKLSILTMAVGIVEKMANVLVKMKDIGPSINSSLDSLFSALDRLICYLFGGQDANGKEGANALSRIGAAMSEHSTNGLFTIAGGVIGGIFGGPLGAVAGAGIGMMLDDDGSGAIKTQLEILISCVGIVATMADALIKMKDLGPDLDKAIDSTFYALKKLTDYFFGSADGKQASALSKVGGAMVKNKLTDLATGILTGGVGLLKGIFGDGSGKINTQIEIIASCVGVVATMADALTKMKDIDVASSVGNLLGSMDAIIDYVLGYDEDGLDNIEDIADEFEDIIECLLDCADEFKGKEDSIKMMEDFANNGTGAITKIINIFTDETTGKPYDFSGIRRSVKDLPYIFGSISMSLDKLNFDFNKAISNLKSITEALGNFNFNSIGNVVGMSSAMDKVTDSLVRYSQNTDVLRMYQLNNFLKSLNSINHIGSGTFDSINTFMDKINTIDIEKAAALKDTFKAFTRINSFGGFFMSFRKQVGLFTEACVHLIDAINGNTDALTSEDMIEEGEAPQEQNKKAIAISNVQELAQQIADAISSGGFGGGGFGDAIPVDLRINGDGGDSWIIRKY